MRELLVLLTIFTSIFTQCQIDTSFDDVFWNNRAAGMATYDVPEASDSRYTSVVYIDPTEAINGAGSEVNPLNEWPSTLSANTAYLQKRGTESTNVFSVNYSDNVLIGAYGVGERPIVSGSTIETHGDSTVFRDIEVHAIRMGAWPYKIADGHWVFNCETKSVAVFTSLTYTKIIGNIIHGSSGELIWVQGAADDSRVGYNIEIAYNHMYDANLAWFPGASEAQAPGDAIQFAAANGLVHVHHNLIDRQSTGNKFCEIYGEPSSPVFDLILENNVYYPPKYTSNGGAVSYLKSIIGSCIVRNNIYYTPETNAMTCIWSQDGDFEFYGNLMVHFSQDMPSSPDVYFNNTIIDVNTIHTSGADFNANNIISTNTGTLGDANTYVDEVGSLFVNEQNNDYRLNSGISGIYNSQYMSEYTYDINNNLVPHDNSIDMGAYQYVQPLPTTTPQRVVRCKAGNTSLKLGGYRVKMVNFD